MFVFSILLITVASMVTGYEVTGDCALPADKGKPWMCPDQPLIPSVRFYMDKETAECLAFKYSGCGGNKNSFSAKSSCRMRCLPMDLNTCPLNSNPVAREDKSSHCSHGLKCPDGSYCSMGEHVGQCCDSKISDEYHANIKGDCGPTKTAVQIDHGFYKELLTGKLCDHDFCPTGATCKQGKHFAYCCQ